MGDGCDGCDGFFELHQSSPKNAVLEEPQDLVEGNAEKQVKECRENPSHPSHPSPASIPAIENPSPDPSQFVEEGFPAEPGKVTEATDEETILDLAELLQLCDSKEALQEIRQISAFTPAVLNQSCKLLSPERHAQIMQWVIELNQFLKVGDRVNWENGPAHCSNLAPFEIMSLDGDYAKLDLFEKLVPLSELERA
jgi:hypothetical protein